MRASQTDAAIYKWGLDCSRIDPDRLVVVGATLCCLEPLFVPPRFGLLFGSLLNVKLAFSLIVEVTSSFLGANDESGFPATTSAHDLAFCPVPASAPTG